MTIEDIIRKFYFNLQMQRREKFTGYELYSHVCQKLKEYNAKIVKEQSVLRRLRNLKDAGILSYDVIDQNGSTYIMK